MNINSSVLLSKYIKAYTLKMVSKAKASHVGGGLSISDIGDFPSSTYLYKEL